MFLSASFSRCHRRLGPALATLLLVSAAPALAGDGSVDIQTGEDWLQALGTGRVQPLLPHMWDEYMMHWDMGEVEGEPYPPTHFFPAELYVIDDLPEPYPDGGGLVMAWGTQQEPDQMYSSAWMYDYGLDPDLSNAKLTLVAWAPTGINKVSFGVRDINGLDRAWVWNPGVNPGFPQNAWVTLTVDLRQNGVTAASPVADSYLNTPGVDLTKIQWFIVDETFHTGFGTVPIPPPGQTTQLYWNAWQSVKIDILTPPPPPGGVKWDQPPAPAHPENVYLGWNQYSEWWNGPVAADDWVCNTPDPVTDVHWWGSFIGWKHPWVPQGQGLPTHFHILFWTDVPANDPANPLGYSHPGQVVHEIICENFRYEFVGWDYDPFTQEFEACFKFEQDLRPEEYFYQDPTGAVTVYWVSIAACYQGEEQPPEFFPWGWKTRPRDADSPAPDAAVSIVQPVQPSLQPPNNLFHDGFMIVGPDGAGWDLAFELTSIRSKWIQPPDPTLSGLHAHDWIAPPQAYHFIVLADDWLCEGGDVLDLHWWGNYEIDAFGNEQRGSGINHFHLSIHASIPGPQGFPVPMEPPLWVMDVPFPQTNETFTGLLNSEGCPIYFYSYLLDFPFPQQPGQWYWLDITARANDPLVPALWRWQEANRSPAFLGHAPAASSSDGMPWHSIIWDVQDPVRFSDLAFAITSDHLRKWSQPPVRIDPPDTFLGWDQFSIYGIQLAADDWLCRTSAPVSDVHWWGSFLGWYHPWLPPMLPTAFHLGIWTDVPADPGTPDGFSHPGVMIWENWCSSYELKFVGWDFDPREVDGLRMPPEATFLFTQILPKEAWFWQEPGENIYWLSIAAIYDVVEPQHPFGWKTRPHRPDLPPPDDAVAIFVPPAPVPGDMFQQGMPLWYPTPAESWDLAFRLTTAGCRGDFDCDFDRDFFDIDLLLAALGGEASWRAKYIAKFGSPPPCDYMFNCDVNGDGLVDFFDIDAFLKVLGQSCP